MSKQGNYVTVPTGSGANPFKGTSDALLGLSEMLSKQAMSEEEQRRFELEESRRAIKAQREAAAYEDAQASKDWYKSFANDYNPDMIRRQRAKQVFGVSDADLDGAKGRDILAAVPLYQEDVTDFYNSAYTSRFGKPLDTATIQPTYSNLPSIKALQTAEDARAKQEGENKRFILGKQIDAAKSLMPSKDRSSKSTKIPKSYEEIDVLSMVEDFDENSWFIPWQSEKQDAHEIAHTALEVLKRKKVPAKYAKAIVRFTLDNLRNEGDLKGVDYSQKRIDRLLDQGIQNANNGVYSGYEGNASAQAYLDNVMKISSNDLRSMNPSDIRSTRRAAAQRRIDQLLGKVAAPAARTTSRTPRPTARRISTSDVWPDSYPGKQGGNVDRPGVINVQMTVPQGEALARLPGTVQEDMLRNLTPDSDGGVSKEGALSRKYLENAEDIKQLQDEVDSTSTDSKWSESAVAKRKELKRAKATQTKLTRNLLEVLPTSKAEMDKIRAMKKHYNELARMKPLLSPEMIKLRAEYQDAVKAFKKRYPDY